MQVSAEVAKLAVRSLAWANLVEFDVVVALRFCMNAATPVASRALPWIAELSILDNVAAWFELIAVGFSPSIILVMPPDAHLSVMLVLPRTSYSFYRLTVERLLIYLSRPPSLSDLSIAV